MIAPDEVEVFSEEEKAKLAAKEQEIDATLRSGKGRYAANVHMGKDDDEAAAFWNEIARRYLAAGWIVDIEKPRQLRAPSRLVIKHPAYAPA
ncbi:hypothetical protein [Sorangium sp. So ce1097]|uniref:hypothetical protein n=1 Tax=Sorangium sp. So ce1097 TaxID=3133330 RepID=UPI003F613DCE